MNAPSVPSASLNRSASSVPTRIVRALYLMMLVVSPLLHAEITPVINKLSDLHAGAILAGATAGTVTLNSPSGTRVTTGGTALGNSVTEVLGCLTLTGKPGNSWKIRTGSAVPFTLMRVGGGSLTVTAVDFEPSSHGTGTFPHSGTTSKFYLGVTIAVGSSVTAPQGTYTGSVLMLLDDTSNQSGKHSTESFTVTVKVDPVITLTRTSELGFGDVFTGSTPGTIILSPTGARSTTGGGLLGNFAAVEAAAFNVNGAAYATFAILLPTSMVMTGPGGSMQVSTFLSSPNGSGLLNAMGQQQLTVGATLNVAANQADGDYRGTFAVTVIYN